MYTWDDLAGRALARQFPDVPGRDAVSVAEALHLIGPIQAQTARAPFLGLAARVPGVDPGDHLGGVRRAPDRPRQQHPRHRAHLHTGGQPAARGRDPDRPTRPVGAHPQAPTHHPRGRLGRHRGLRPRRLAHPGRAERPPRRLAPARTTPTPGRGSTTRPAATSASATAACCVVRSRAAGRPRAAPGYRTASAVIGDRAAVLADPDASMDALVRRHVASYGPASRHDIAWWAGVGLRVVDASLATARRRADRRGGSRRPPLPRPDRRSSAP